MAVDLFCIFFPHLFFYVLVLFHSDFVFRHERQIQLANSLVNFLTHVNLFSFDLICFEVQIGLQRMQGMSRTETTAVGDIQ